MMKIREVLDGKQSAEIVTIRPDATVRELLRLLSTHNIGAVIVSSDGQSLDGIVSERDIVRRLYDDEASLDGTVSGIMTSAVHSVSPDDSLDDTRRLMTERRFRHVPVVDGGTLVGIVSIGDVVKAHIGQVEFERDQLDSYVRQV
jgi:CBS domain-containing protein